MEENNKFELNDLFKGKNLAIVILSGLLFVTILALGGYDSDSVNTDELNNTINTLQEQVKTLENEKTELQNNNTELEKQVQDLNKQIEELKVSKENKQKEVSTASVKPQTSYSSSAETSSTYVLNTNTKKFHYASCSSVSRMKDSNKREFNGTRDEVISKGYSPCQRCNP